MSVLKHFFQTFDNNKPKYRSMIITILLIINCVAVSQNVQAASSVIRNRYTFIQEQSSIYKYYNNGSSIFYERYFLIQGQFGFSADRYFNSAYFTDSNSIVIEASSNSYYSSFSELFNLQNLQLIFINNTSVQLKGNTNDGTYSEINITLGFSDDVVYINATITPPSVVGNYYEMNAVAVRKYGGGIGTTQYPYIIGTSEHMNTIGLNRDDWSSNFILTSNINMSNYKQNLNMIGYYNSENDNRPFSGIFDGNNKEIKNLTLAEENSNAVGLFGYIEGKSAEIRDLRLVDPKVSSEGGEYVGALVGRLVDGSIDKCYVSGGQVSGSGKVGGLIGWQNTIIDFRELNEDGFCNNGMVTRCFCETDVTGENEIGGLIGLNDGIIIDCNSVGHNDVNGITEVGSLAGLNNGIIIDCNLAADGNIIGDEKVGGFVGTNKGVIIYCTAKGRPNIVGTNEIGGLIGVNDGIITDCEIEVLADIYGQSKIGGLAGINNGVISNCNSYEYIEVTGLTEIGGIVGLNKGLIEDCNSTASVTGEKQIGGMIGYNLSHIRRCYSVCTVSGNKKIGALVGKNNGIIEQCLAEGDVSGNENVGGIAGINEGGYIKSCSSICDVEGDILIGGFTGTNSGSIINCYSEGNLSGDFYVSGGAGKNYFHIVNCVSDSVVDVIYGYAGGIAGTNESNGLIENSYSTGNMSGRLNTGGLIGFNDGVVIKCYSTGKVTDNYDNDSISVGFGGLIGEKTVEACVLMAFWDIQTSSQIDSAGGIGKTTSEMKNKTTFADWAKTSEDDTGDEVVYWTIYQQGSKDYPRLSWEEMDGDVIVPVLITDLLSGSGTAGSPYIIDTPDKLNSIGLYPHEWDKHFKVTANINMSGYSGKAYNLIGYYRIPFGGIFDGNNRVISNLSFDSGEQSYVGLFGCIESYFAQVNNVEMTDATINAKDNIGALVGYLKEGKVDNCHAENVNITGHEAISGLVGNNLDTIRNSSAAGNVTGSRYIGGLVGNNAGSIEDSTSASSVSANTLAGGIAGYNIGTVENSSSSGYISGTERIGGLVGSNNGDLTSCYSNAFIYGDLNIGGLVGYNKDADITSSYAIGNVYGRLSTGGLIGYNSGNSSIDSCYVNNSVTGSESIGGLIGKNEGNISKCYSLGIVSGATDIGGLVGWNLESASISNSYSRSSVLANQWAGGLAGINNGSIDKCYSSGNVAGAKMTVGGLVAINYGTSSGSLWDTETSGQTVSATGTGKTTENMQKQATYTSAGWNFQNIWEINENQDYPKLNWQAD